MKTKVRSLSQAEIDRKIVGQQVKERNRAVMADIFEQIRLEDEAADAAERFINEEGQ